MPEPESSCQPAQDQAHAAEERIAEMLGPRRFGQMRDTLEELADRVTHANRARLSQ
jgi:hypothetical protein